MKRLVFVFAALMMLLRIPVVSAADIMKYPRVAVMQFANKAIQTEDIRREDFDSAAEYAIYQLSALGWFDLIDYEQLHAIAKMHQINNTGLVDPSTVVQIGKFAGAQFMIVGSVTGLTTKESKVGLEASKGSRSNIETSRSGGLDTTKRTVIANVSMRIVDIETGRIVVAGLGKGESSSAQLEVSLRKSKTVRNNGASESNANVYEPFIESEVEGEVIDGIYNSVPSVGDTTTGSDMAYSVKIGSERISDVQLRNAVSKAVRDAIYGKMGLLTTLNGGKQLKIKTGF